ncbi:MAG: hypothetical protein EXR05_10905 [Acetobacteraceae bacterium]|nr:hypothetical protein [Acetobacteraceae bacterium]MSP29953.1 hypothetical protein [Acetobacteraceae bacterium]
MGSRRFSDPANNLVVADEHVVLAWGRDYVDTSPVRGVMPGCRQHNVTVRVELMPIADGGMGPEKA